MEIVESARHEKDGAANYVLSRLADWSREASVWPVSFGLACCAIEMMATGASRFDIARFGSELFRASPRQADLMIVAGRVSQKMAPVLREIYDQMPEPKWVIAMGDCASCTGVFNNYALVQGVDKIVPVDMYIPGCPPTPDALMDGLLKLKARIVANSRSNEHGHQTGPGIGVARQGTEPFAHDESIGSARPFDRTERAAEALRPNPMAPTRP